MTKPETKQAPEWAIKAAEYISDELSQQVQRSGRDWIPNTGAIAHYIFDHLDPAVKELVEAAKEAEESLRHTVEDMKADGAYGWRLEMRQERLGKLQSALEPFGGE